MKQPDFIQIPTQLLADERLTPADRVMYGYIYWMSKLKNERCTASSKTLADFAKMSAASVRNTLTRLERCGYIARFFADDSRHNRLEIVPLVSYSSSVSSTNDAVSLSNDDVSSTNDARVSLDNEQNKSSNNKKRKKNNMSTSNELDPPQLKKFFYELVEALGFDVNRVIYTEQRRKKLQLRLKVFSRDKICEAARAIADDAFLQGENDSGKRYGDIDFLLRSDENLEKRLDRNKKPEFKEDWR